MGRLTPRRLRVVVAAVALSALFVPPGEPVEILFVYSNDATDLLAPIIRAFNQRQDDVTVNHLEGASGRVKGAIVEGTLEPVIWMPAASTWARLLNHELGRTIAPADAPSLFWSPQVIGTFEALQDDVEIEGWRDLVRLANDRPGFESGPFRLGHTRPTTSTSGLYALLSEFAAVHPSGEPIVDEDTLEGVRTVEETVLHYGDIAEDFCPLVGQYGDRYVKAFYMQETTFLQCDPGGHRLVEVVPEETYIADYPLITLEGSWVTAQQATGAERFIEFLEDHLSREDVLAEKYRFGDPWDENRTNDPAPPGAVDPAAWRAIDVPTVEALVNVQEAWPLVRKPADLMILLERGADMSLDDRLNDAIGTAERLLGSLAPDVHVGLTAFDDDVDELAPIDALSGGYDQVLLDRLRGVNVTQAVRPALCDALGTAIARVRQEDRERIGVVLVLAQGRDEVSPDTCTTVVQVLRQASSRTSPVQVYAITFGDDADAELLSEITEASFGWCADASDEVTVEPCDDISVAALLDDLDGMV